MRLLLILLTVSILAAPLEDLVDAATYTTFKIPYTGKMYSGYLPITQDGAKAFHYFAFPAVDLATGLKASKTPLMLWLNGGPGCSSLFGALNENGPFIFELGTNNLKINEYSWNHFAHMFYLETPAGVGFSYGDENTSDALSAKDNLIAVIEFLKKFPEYKDLDLYIAGESYAGAYIPNLASEIIDYNQKQTDPKDKIQLKGLLIGNGCTDPTECTIEAKRFPFHKFDYYAAHNLISPTLKQQLSDNLFKCYNSDDQFCKDLYAKVNQEMFGSQEFYFNPYNIYGTCYTLPVTTHNGTVIPRSKVQFDPVEDRMPGTVPSCSEAQGLFYLFTNPEFMKAIHITTKSKPWQDCSAIKYTKDPRATYYLYPKLMENGIRILKFSGDVDGVVPITGTLYWIDKLQREYELPTLEAWRPWFIPGKFGSDSQNAGNVWIIDGLTFVSVRNAGHMVPMDQPEAASIMASHFIYDYPLPYINIE